MGSLLRRLIQLFGMLAFASLAFGQVGNLGASGQQSVTGSAVVLAVPSTLATVCVQALPGNTSPAVIYVGFTASVTTSTGYPLSAGQAFCGPLRNGAAVYVIASGTGSGVAWFGTYQ